MTDKTPIQQILYGAYFEAWRDRNGASQQVGRALHDLAQARSKLLKAQRFLELVSTALSDSGFDMQRVRCWPIETRPEQEITGREPVADRALSGEKEGQDG